MSNKKISQLTPAGPLVGTEEIELNQSAVSVKTTIDDISTFITSSIVTGGIQRINQDITGSTTVSLAGTSGTVAVDLYSSGGTEIINAISNFSNVDIVYLFIRIPTALDITFNDSSTVSGGNIKLFATPLLALGLGFGFLKLVKRGSIFYQEVFIDQYV